MYCLSAQLPFAVETESEGPNRTVVGLDKVWKVAYSGDNWHRDVSKAATLTFISPSGAETTMSRTGTGTESFTFDTFGIWTVRLTMADDTMYEATINVIKKLFTVSFR